MSRHFEPREVEPGATLRWMREGFLLIKRRPAPAVAIGIGGALVFALTFHTGTRIVAAVPTTFSGIATGLSIFALLAIMASVWTLGLLTMRVADRSLPMREVFDELAALAGRGVRHALLMLYAAIFANFMSVFSLTLILIIAAVNATWSPGAGAPLEIGLLGVVFYGSIWGEETMLSGSGRAGLRVCLTVLTEASFRETAMLSREAFNKNAALFASPLHFATTAVVPFTTTALSLLLSYTATTALLSFIPVGFALTFSMGTCYAMYRDIFEHRESSAPARAVAGRRKLVQQTATT